MLVSWSAAEFKRSVAYSLPAHLLYNLLYSRTKQEHVVQQLFSYPSESREEH